MENMYVWLFLFAGSTIALLGVLLLTSERQLRKKRRELEAIAQAHSNSTLSGDPQDFETQSPARQQELLEKISLLSNKLEESQRMVTELQAEKRGWAMSADSDKQQEQAIINLRSQLEASESQLRDSAGEARANAERNLQLQSDLAELARQQQANQATMAELQAEQERILQDAQSEKQNLRAENQQLQREIAELRSQLQTTEALLGAKSDQYAELMERHGQLQSDVAEIKQQLDDLTLTNRALAEEKAALLSQLAGAQKTIDELRMLQDGTQSENQHLQTANQELRRDLAKLNLDLQSIRSQLGEAERQAHNSADRHSQLEQEAGELKEQLRASQSTIEQFHTDEERWSAIDLENQKLRQVCADLREQLQNSDSRISELSRLNQESADQYARLRGDAAELARRLEETQSQIREFDRLQQELASVESREMILKRRQDEQETQIASLHGELSDARGKAQELAAASNRLAEVERLYQELRDEHQQLEEEISRQESCDSSKEGPEEIDAHPEPHEESQQRRAQLLEPNHEEVRLSVSNTDLKHILQRTTDAGGELSREPVEPSALNPLRPLPNTVSAPTNSPTAGPGDSDDHRMPVYSDDDDFCTATAVKKRVPGRKTSRAAAISAIVVLAIAAGGAAGILGTRYFASTDATVTREFLPAAPSMPGEAASQNAEPKPEQRLQGKFKIVRATGVYSEPTEKSALITRIEPGIKVNVVDSRDGWLEIRSKYGRPPGFVREGTAVKID